MTQTLNPVITVTVSGPVGSGKSVSVNGAPY